MRRNLTNIATDASEPRPRGKDPRAPPLKESPCRACRAGNRARTDPEHTRIIGECAYPYDQPVYLPCKGCIRAAPASQTGPNAHTFKLCDCRLATAHTRQRRSREGHHPRDARLRVSDSDTAGQLDGLVVANLEQLMNKNSMQPVAEGQESESTAATRGPDQEQRQLRPSAHICSIQYRQKLIGEVQFNSFPSMVYI